MHLPKTKLSLLVALVMLAASVPAAHASISTYVTPSGSSTVDGAVNASATFITGPGTVSITLTDLLANPKSVGQLISDLDFLLSNGATTGTLFSSSGQQITVNSGGTSSTGSTGVTGWGVNNNVSGGLQLNVLGFEGPDGSISGGPDGLIIGPPNGSGLYSNANGSIAGNGPHNPFLNQTATFVVNVSGVDASTQVTSATFSFGTGCGEDDEEDDGEVGCEVPGTPSTSVPEPSSVLLLSVVMAGLLINYKRLT